jgi:polyphenol oxidase
MFSFANDPGADGVGIAFFDAVAPDGGRFDLTVSAGTNLTKPDWVLAEQLLGVPVLNAYQVHGARALVVSHSSDRLVVAAEPADALVTTDRKLGLAVRIADCLPVLLADPAVGVVAAAHAGRVGLLAGVLVSATEQMRRVGATNLHAWIGPHICGDCYEVPAQLQQDYLDQFPTAAAITTWGTPSLDLGAAAAAQLAELGCTVTRVDPCTRTSTSLHSYRRDGATAGRQAAVVWLP